jgi:hypothetical protein
MIRTGRHSAPTAGTDALTRGERETFEAIAARIWPGTDADPGARQAGALRYLERALAGPYRALLDAYRDGLTALNHAAVTRYGHPFARLSDTEQDALLAAMDTDDVPEFTSMPAREFFTMCIEHTMEGVFSDPIHGGNRDFAGWRVVGYPGPQGSYSAAEQIQGTPLHRPLRSVEPRKDTD